MYSPLLNIVMQYGGAVLVGIATGLISKAYFLSQLQKKIKGYQMDIVKSHSKILELEAANDKLEKQLNEKESTFSREHLFMN